MQTIYSYIVFSTLTLRTTAQRLNLLFWRPMNCSRITNSTPQTTKYHAYNKGRALPKWGVHGLLFLQRLQNSMQLYNDENTVYISNNNTNKNDHQYTDSFATCLSWPTSSFSGLSFCPVLNRFKICESANNAMTAEYRKATNVMTPWNNGWNNSIVTSYRFNKRNHLVRVT